MMIYWTPYSRKQWEKQDVGESIKWDSNNIPLYNQLKEYLLPIVPNLIQQMLIFLDCGKADSAKTNI